MLLSLRPESEVRVTRRPDTGGGGERESDNKILNMIYCEQKYAQKITFL